MAVTKLELKSQLLAFGISIYNDKYIRKKDVARRILLAAEDFYQIPKIPDELRFAKSERERKYLAFIDTLLDIVKRDPMTGLTHKEHFKSTREDMKGVYIMIDGDGLKKLNDTYGHAAGHSAIQCIADAVKKEVRNEDDVNIQRKKKGEKNKYDASRYGGDEFIVFIQNISIPSGVKIAKRILKRIHEQDLSKYYKGSEDTKIELVDVGITASLGVGYSEEEADIAVYKAKKAGRNRVEFYKEGYSQKIVKEEGEEVKRVA